MIFKSLRSVARFAAVLATISVSLSAWAVTRGQVDDFENGTTQSWTVGAGDPTGPTNVTTGGPAGAGDNFLQYISDGAGPGGKMIVINQNQWKGNYVAAGVSEIRAQIKVITGPASLSLRVGLQATSQIGQQWGYASSSAVVVLNDGGWHEVVFPIMSTDLTAVGGTPLTYNQTMIDVGHLRIFHSTTTAWHAGGAISATMGVDNVMAGPLPQEPILFDNVAGLSDINMNGVPDIAVYVQVATSRVHIRDGSTGALLSDIDYGDDPVTGMAVIADISGNGMPEVALLGTRPDDNVRVQVKDSLTGATVNNIFYGTAYSAVDMTVLPDTDNNGADELAVVGADVTGGVRVQARDALSDVATSTTYYGDKVPPMDVLVVPDVSTNGEPEVLMHGRVTASNQGRAQMRDSSTKALLRNMFFGSVYAPLELAVIEDISGDGIPDLAQLGRRDDTGAVRIQVKRSDTGATISNAFTGSVSTPITLVGIGDANGNSASDVALLVELTGGTARIIVRDGATGAFIRNTFVDLVSNPIAMSLVPDMNGSGDPELAVLGDDGAGTKRVQIKDSISGAQINTIDFP